MELCGLISLFQIHCLCRQRCHRIDPVVLLLDDLPCTGIGILQHAAHLAIDVAGGLLAERFGEGIARTRRIVVADRADLLAHTVVSHHRVGGFRRPFQIAQCTRAERPVVDLLGDPAAQQTRQLLFERFVGNVHPLLVGHRPRGLENNPGKDGKLFSDKHPYVTEAHPGAKKAVDALTRRINEMIAEMPDNLTLEEKTDIARNNLKIEKALGVTKGKPMTYEQANKGKENPKFGKEEGYRVNCQTCTVTHMLRRLGFDIEAKPNIRQSAYNEMAKQGITWEERFLNRDGTKPDYDYTYKWQVRKGYQVMNANRLKEYFREKFREDGIYEIYCAWKGGSAHVFCAEVTEGKTRFFDPQTGKDDASNYIQSMKAGRVGVIRIDNKLVNPKIMGLFITK